MSNCTAVAGIEFCPNSPAVFIEYSVVNVICTSIIPVPLAGPLAAVGTLLFGLWLGLVVNVLTSTAGAWIGLVCVRYACRPCCMRMIGRYEKRWRALDAALTAQGWQIALLIRVAPISPMVLTNILLSLTSIPLHTYLWTCFLGIFPANLPYAYAAQAGVALSEGFPPKDPVMLIITIVGLLASLAIAWKIGVIAKRLLKRHGITDEGPSPPSPHTMADVGDHLAPDTALPPAAEGEATTGARGDDTDHEVVAVRGRRDDEIELAPCQGSGVNEKVPSRGGRRGKTRHTRSFHSFEDERDVEEQ